MFASSSSNHLCTLCRLWPTDWSGFCLSSPVCLSHITAALVSSNQTVTISKDNNVPRWSESDQTFKASFCSETVSNIGLGGNILICAVPSITVCELLLEPELKHKVGSRILKASDTSQNTEYEKHGPCYEWRLVLDFIIYHWEATKSFQRLFTLSDHQKLL